MPSCRTVGLLAIPWVLSLACQSQPTRAQAQVWAEQLDPTIDAIETAVLRGVEEVPRFHDNEPDCGGLVQTEKFNACYQKSITWSEDSAKAESMFASKVLAPLLDIHPNLVGVWVNFREDGDHDARFGHRLGAIGNAGGPNKIGHTPPEEGFSREKRQYGWGLGQTSVSFGNSQQQYGSSDYAPMLHVRMTRNLTLIEIEVHLVLLTKTTTDAQWRQAWHSRVVRSDPRSP